MKGFGVPLIVVVFLLLVVDVVVVPLLQLRLMMIMIILHIAINKVTIELEFFKGIGNKAPKSSQSWT